MSEGEEQPPSQWIPLKDPSPSGPRPSHTRLSLSLDSMFVSVIESEEFDRSVSTNDGPNEDANSKLQPQLAAKETKAVNCLKFILLLILLVASCGFAALVYTYTNNEENKEFQETFIVYSQQIEDAVQVSAQNRLEAIGALAFQMQAYSHYANETWPFVTVPFFEDQVYSMKSLTDAFGVNLFPIVSQENRKAWEEYSVAHRQWINESYASQERKGEESGEILPSSNETWFDVLWGEGFVTSNPPDFSSGISDHIFRGWDPKNESIRGPYISEEQDLYFPQWQGAPLSWYSQSTVNQNYGQFEDFYNSTVISIETGHAVMGIAWTDTVVPGFISTMLYPIYREIHPEATEASSDVVAFLGADIYWREYLTDIFQDKSAGATVVIENNVNQNFTYKITGTSVAFIGEGDHHDRSYDYMEESFVFGSHLSPTAETNVSSHAGAYLHQEWVRYAFRIYPSQDLEESFHTNQPIVYTVVVLLVILTATGTFFLYDYLVERRQQVVLRTAERSDAIVSSLFPKKIKEQLYRNSTGDSGRMEEKKQPNGKSSGKASADPNKEGHSDLSDRARSGAAQHRPSNTSLEGAVAGLQQQSAKANPKLEGPPIAELYEEATVFFADMVGFTAWSSQRSPADVFTLLETCYGAFDVIAHRRGVFKVETIGDCYVAVSGIPISRSDHAVIMAKFAKDLLHCLREELVKLVPVLGSATASLAMRVGMHSGPVTAGVLRGERARFQLFGDTVNTAARMESTGLRNRIQLSKATADLLIKAGKQSWIIKRSDEVEAKGKGLMQTYWLKCSVPFAMTKPTTTPHSRAPQERTSSESDESSTNEKDSDDDVANDDKSYGKDAQETYGRE